MRVSSRREGCQGTPPQEICPYLSAICEAARSTNPQGLTLASTSYHWHVMSILAIISNLKRHLDNSKACILSIIEALTLINAHCEPGQPRRQLHIPPPRLFDRPYRGGYPSPAASGTTPCAPNMHHISTVSAQFHSLPHAPF